MRRQVPQTVPEIDFATLDLLPYGIIVVDEAGTIVFYNDREQEISGAQRQDVLGRNFFTEVAPCTQVQSFHGQFRELMERGDDVVRFQFRFPFVKRPRDVEITLTPFQNGDSLFCLIAVSDLNERERGRIHLMQGERFRALGEVAAGVSHNFNNILMVIQTFARVLDKESLSPSGREAVQEIAKATADAVAITARIRSTLGTQAIGESEVFDLSAVAADALQWTEAAALEMTHGRMKAIVFENRLKAPQLVAGNAVELREAILNLLRNAVDAIGTEGRIVVGGGGTLPGEARVTVTDTGAGMESATLSRLFQPLFTTKGAHGSGLGLVATYTAIQRHGGQISVDSTVGMGTTFTISLPLARIDGG